MPSTCREADSPVLNGRAARAIASQRRMRMDHEVLSDTPQGSAQALRDGPDSMSDTQPSHAPGLSLE